MAKTRSNGEGNIRLRSDGRYEVRVSGGVDFTTGQHIRISRYANSMEEAIQLLHKLNLAVGNSSAIQNQKIVLEDWLELWMDIYMKGHLKQSTYMSYETYARKHFNPALGKIPLTELTPRLLQQFYNYKMETEKLSPKSISNMNLYLHKALDQAVREGIIPDNPASHLDLPHSPRPQVTIFTRDEQARLVRASYQHRYGVFIRLVLMTGIRLGELLGLKWEDIDFRSRMMHIRRTLNRLQIPGLPENHKGPKTEIVLQEPKTSNSARSIPLLPNVLQDLLRWRTVQEADRTAAGDRYQESGMIVTNPLGGYIEPRTFSDYYAQILALAGLPHFTFHALRHTFASRAMEQGMDEKTLSVLLGHYSVSFTLDTYAHVLDD
ncbi:MAG: site-specific integrase, partial [Clostridiales bacterium]|nr:site-specific integrase [Clostridiales bacterium]